jgi:hypothetical protein
MGHRAYPKLKHLPAKLLANPATSKSQSKLGKLLDVNCARLSEFDSGRRQPSLPVLLAHARAANVLLENPS